jgi:hypothetical protein
MSSTSSWSEDVGTQQSLLLERGRAFVAYLLRQGKNVRSIAPDGRLVILARALRTFGYGFTSVLLGIMLTRAGLSAVYVGLLLAVAALGSITLSLVMGMFADRLGRKRSLVISALLMMATGFAFAFTRYYPLLLIAAFCGTISPSTNDNTPFSGIEQSVLAQSSPPTRGDCYRDQYAQPLCLVRVAGWKYSITLSATLACCRGTAITRENSCYSVNASSSDWRGKLDAEVEFDTDQTLHPTEASNSEHCPQADRLVCCRCLCRRACRPDDAGRVVYSPFWCLARFPRFALFRGEPVSGTLVRGGASAGQALWTAQNYDRASFLLLRQSLS